MVDEPAFNCEPGPFTVMLLLFWTATPKLFIMPPLLTVRLAVPSKPTPSPDELMYCDPDPLTVMVPLEPDCTPRVTPSVLFTTVPPF